MAWEMVLLNSNPPAGQEVRLSLWVPRALLITSKKAQTDARQSAASRNSAFELVGSGAWRRGSGVVVLLASLGSHKPTLSG